MAFTLEPRRWYGWQMVPGYELNTYLPFCCPCLINKVMPKKSGNGLLTLDLWVTGYAEGVNQMEFVLKILHRAEKYLIAHLLYPESSQFDRCVVISHIELEWVKRFCPYLWEGYPPERMGNAANNISDYLKAIFQPPYEWRPDISTEAVICCALRFDGGKRDEELNGESPNPSTYTHFKLLHDEHFAKLPWQLHSDPLVNWSVFYWLQRSDKWSGLDAPAARLQAWLFTRLHDQAVPIGYENPEYADRYTRLKPQAAALAKQWMAHF